MDSHIAAAIGVAYIYMYIVMCTLVVDLDKKLDLGRKNFIKLL